MAILTEFVFYLISPTKFFFLFLLISLIIISVRCNIMELNDSVTVCFGVCQHSAKLISSKEKGEKEREWKGLYSHKDLIALNHHSVNEVP